jgi:hypothetical protein
MSGMIGPTYNAESETGSRTSWGRALRILGASAVLVAGLWWSAVSLDFRSLVFALVANWLIVAWVALIGPAIRWRLPGGYLRLRAWERDGRLYRRLGVPAFGTLIRRTPLRVLSPDIYLRGRPGRLTTVLALSGRAEAVHVWIFLLALPLVLYAVARGWWDAAVWLLLVNALLNLYPVMQQRMIRGRLERTLARTRSDSPTGPRP